MRIRSLLAAMAVLAATPALADVKTFASAHGWEAFGGTSSSGKPLCGVSVDTDDSFFSLKYFKGDGELTVQLSDSDWDFKAGDKFRIGMAFDNRTPWKADATAFKMDKDMALQFTVSSDVVDDWLDDFKMGYKLYIVFDKKGVSSWTADLTGTKVIGEAFEKCVDVMTGH